MPFSDDRSPHRLQGDLELVRAIRAAGPDSTAFRHLDETLMDYVIGTLTNLNSSKRLRAEVKRQCGITLPSPPLDWGEHARRVIFFSVRTGVSRFMEKDVVGGRWDHRKGASVKTSAVRKGLYSFADEYKLFLSEERGKEQLFADPATLPARVALTSPAADPALLAVHHDRLRRVMEGQSDLAIAIFNCVIEGMTHAEIASDLNTDVDTVARQWRATKNTIRKRLGKATADEAAEQH